MGFLPDYGIEKVTEAHPDRDLYFYASEVTDEGFVLATPGTYVFSTRKTFIDHAAPLMMSLPKY